MATSASDRLLSIGEAAAIGGVSVDTMRRYEEQGRIHAERTPGGQRRFRLADVEQLFAPQVTPEPTS